jgi:hypothetical protein
VLKTASPGTSLDISTTVSLGSSGTYYLLVSGTGHGSGKYSDYASLGQYDINGSFQTSGSPSPPPPPPATTTATVTATTTPSSSSCSDDAKEPNNQYYNAASISPGSTYQLTHCGDDDFFSYRPSCEDQVITITFSEQDADLDLYVYDANWNLIDKSNGFTGTESVQLTVSGTSKINIYVKAYSGVGSYALKITEACRTTAAPTTEAQDANIISGSGYAKYTMKAQTNCNNNLFQYCLTSTGPTRKGLIMKLVGPSVIVGKKRKPLNMGSVKVTASRTKCITKARTVTSGETYTLTISGQGTWDLEYSTLSLSSGGDCV